MNINGLNAKGKDGGRVNSMLGKLLKDYQLIAFQETKFTIWDNLRIVTSYINSADSKAKIFWSQRSDDDFTGNNGVALILSGSHPFTSVEDVTTRFASVDQQPRYLVLDAKIGDFRVFIHVVYAPVNVAERKRYFNTLPTRFPDAANHIVLGDLNTPMDPLLDEKIPYPHDLARDELQLWMLELGLMDPWRATFPEHRLFSGPKERNRIDYCLVTTDIYDEYYRSSRYVTEKKWFHEDHFPMEFHLTSPSHPGSKRLPWKCPRWLLDVPLVRDTLNYTLDRLAARLQWFSGSNPGVLLDEHKTADRAFLQEMQRSLKNTDDDRLAKLRVDVRMAKALDAACSSEATRTDLVEAKAALKALEDLFADRREKTKFDRDITEGESGSAFFFRAPTAAAYSVAIPNVTRSDGTTTNDPGEMAAEHRHYWGSLYQSPSRDLQGTTAPRRYDPVDLQRLLKHTTKRLTEEQRQMLDAPFTANDFFWAIHKSPKGRSAGYDGLPAEYYQLNTSLWAQVYEIVYASNFDRGMMSKSQRKAYISLLFKGGDRSIPSNYRPITLLNHDAKFGPKIQAWRLRDILPLLLHTDQTGFVKGRSIRHALLRFQDLQTLAKRLRWTKAGAVLLDYAKAFDSVLWAALLLVLRHMGFSDVFCDRIMTFFRHTLVSVLVNGTASQFFELGCGVRQGDPLSPALFVLFVEPMLNYLRATTGHMGLQVPGAEETHHLLAFADDCTGLLRDLGFAPEFIAAVQVYAVAAGLRLNVAKTHLFPFEPLPPDIRQTLEEGGWDVVADDAAVRLLGIYVSPSLPTSSRFPKVLKAMVDRCRLWRYRARTLRGRAVILRAIVLPLLWYTAAVTRVPPDVATQVKRLCKSFLFKKEISETRAFNGPMAEEWLYWPTSQGGLGLPETTTFSQALQLCSLRDAMHSVTVSHTVPRWFAAAFVLMDGPLEYGNTGLNILYVPVPNGLTVPGPWRGLDPFWIEPLRVWHSLVVKYCVLADIKWAQMEMPYWQNHFLRANKANHLTGKASKNAYRFFSEGYVRIQDFVNRHGSLPTVQLCMEILGEENFATRDKWTGAARFFSNQVQRLLDLDVSKAPIEGPHLPANQCAASHGWTFNKVVFILGMNHEFYHLLHELPVIARQPHGPLGIAVEPDWKDHWRRERGLDRDLLPILSDIKFRLQHNGLNFRVKYRYRTDDVLCPHGCGVVEDGEHLFWSCSVAQTVWEFFLLGFNRLLVGAVSWPTIVYLQQLVVRTEHFDAYGSHNILRVFNVLRCSVLYMLWLHRNDCLMNGSPTNMEYVRERAKSYVQLHLRRMCAVSTRPNPRLKALCRRWLPASTGSPTVHPEL